MKTLLLILLSITTFGQTSYTFIEEVKNLKPEKALVLTSGFLENAENIMTIDQTLEAPQALSLDIPLRYGKKNNKGMIVTHTLNYNFTVDFKENRYRLRINDLTLYFQHLITPIPFESYREDSKNLEDPLSATNPQIVTGYLEHYFNTLNTSLKTYLTKHTTPDDW